MEKFFNRHLPKWPGILVKGEKVTIDQAKEIIIRTDDLRFSSNDREFDKQLNFEVFGIQTNGWNLTESVKAEKGIIDFHEIWDWIEKKLSRYKPLSLNYLENSRVVSSWVGGPKGWCDWKGNISASNYNIGKYPSVEDVYNEWCLIAKEFPFLDLKAQLLNCEMCEDDAVPEVVVEYVVKNGLVEIRDSDSLLSKPTFPDFMRRINDLYGERGCSIEQFKDAINYVENKFK